MGRPQLTVPLTPDEVQPVEDAFQKFSAGKLTVTKKSFVLHCIQYWMKGSAASHPELDELQQANVALQGRVATLTDENKKLTDSLTRGGEFSSEHDEMHHELQQANVALHTHNAALQHDIYEIHQRVATLTDENLKLNQLLESKWEINQDSDEMQQVYAASQRRVAAGKSADLADFIWQIFTFTRENTNSTSLLK